ncbi:MAG: hypothetical protein GX956_06185 [Firmicutes bacterium]|nr:hypothetical protein [Bacillota bacterium]
MEPCTQKHRIDRLESDVTEIKQVLNETAKKTDVQELKEAIEKRDSTYTKNLWRLIWILIAVFTGIVAISTGLNLADIPVIGG